MTTEEAIKILDPETSRDALWKYEDKEKRLEAVNEACRLAVAALRAQQTSAKLDRSRWEGCEFCLSERQDQGPCVCACSSFNISNKQYATRFCPVCGKPLIEEAWAELERRIGGNDGN